MIIGSVYDTALTSLRRRASIYRDAFTPAEFDRKFLRLFNETCRQYDVRGKYARSLFEEAKQ